MTLYVTIKKQRLKALFGKQNCFYVCKMQMQSIKRKVWNTFAFHPLQNKHCETTKWFCKK